MSIIKLILSYFIIISFFNPLSARDFLLIQSTTSTENSGILKILENEFEKKYNIEVRSIITGTGQAIKNATNGDADILIVHSKKDELQFIKEGYGIQRVEFMYNDFVLVGPSHDPAEIKKFYNIKDIMHKISKDKIKFVSRDDDSGTNKKEKNLWAISGIQVNHQDKWYLKTGQGMGATLNIASELDAYTLSDRGTWISFKNKQNLAILYEKNQLLLNPYSVIIVNPKKFNYVDYAKAKLFSEWLLSKHGKTIINDYKINGKQLFYAY